MGNKYESGFGIEMKTEETGLVELIVKIPHLTPENAKTIVRDARRALENCGSLNLLGEFIEMLRVEYTEIPVEGAVV